MGKKFTKRVENFTCEICGTKVKGTGFTDHCPRCLRFPGRQKSRLRRPDEASGSITAKGEMANFLPLSKMRFGKV